MLVIKKWWNKLFPDTNEMNELWRMTFYMSESGIETVLWRLSKFTVLWGVGQGEVKFSLSDQYLCYYKVLTILDIPSFL